MKRILISGGLGFVGRHLVEELLGSGDPCRITVVDNLSGTEIEPRQLAGLERRVEVHRGDFCDYAPDGRRFDALYHLASPVGSLGILPACGRVAKQIVDLATAAVRICGETGAKLLYVSSSEVYARSATHREDSAILLEHRTGARTEYAVGKYASEILVANSALVSELRYNICRPFNLIGEFQSSSLGFVVPRFFEAARRGDPLPLFGDGRQQRSFCHVRDFTRGLVALQESELLGETLNLGNDRDRISIRHLAEKIRQLCRSASPIEHVDPVELYGQAYVEGYAKLPDVTRAREILGWEPEIRLDEALDRIHRHDLERAERPAGAVA